MTVMNRTRKPRRTLSQRSGLIHDFHEFGLYVDTREIVLMSNPEGEDGIDHVCANTFLKNLTLLNSFNHQPIIVHQASVGGDWHYGMAIYDAVLTSASPVILLAHGHARSMSSVIPQAAKKRVIMPHACVMIHFGGSGYEGDARSFVAEGRYSDLLDAQMLDIYAAKCSRGPFFRRKKFSRKTREYLKQRMNEIREWYMTPTEAIDKGFMDGIFGTPGYRNLDELRAL